MTELSWRPSYGFPWSVILEVDSFPGVLAGSLKVSLSHTHVAAIHNRLSLPFPINYPKYSVTAVIWKQWHITTSFILQDFECLKLLIAYQTISSRHWSMALHPLTLATATIHIGQLRPMTTGLDMLKRFFPQLLVTLWGDFFVCGLRAHILLN